jgi:16S rRNA (cytidine1402-2'-O)-methyltransferase
LNELGKLNFTFLGLFKTKLMLHIIPTPIGNLEDITLRAIRMLKEVDLILAEDTRVTKKLLSHYDIGTPLRSYHAHNEHKITQGLVDQMKSEDVNIALVSDAGTPGISDPGFLLVRACVNEGIKVECLPGATAFVPALVSSGIPCDKFHYEGFLPHKKGRQTRLIYLSALEHTFVLYESPNRLVKCLTQLAEFCGMDRKAAVCRELSKLHEEVRTDSLENLIAYFGGQAKVRGEIAIVVEGKK